MVTDNLKFILFKRSLKTYYSYILFAIYKCKALYFNFIGNTESSIQYWQKSVKLYEKKKNFLFYKEHDKTLSKLTFSISHKFDFQFESKTPIKENILFLTSNIYDFGGHSRVLYDIVRNIDKQLNKIFIFVTEIEDSVDSTNTNLFQLLKNEVYDLKVSSIAYGRYSIKINELIEYIANNGISKIVLFEHAWDIVSIVSAIKVKQSTNIKIIYYHHQNLHLTVFPDICDCYVEIMNDVYRKTKKYYSNIEFVEIPVEFSGTASTIALQERSENLTFLTASPFTKIFAGNNLVFLNLVVKLLKAFPESRYVIVTKNNQNYIGLLKSYFKRKGVIERVEIRHSVTNLFILNKDYDIYIDGLPIGGGKTILEMAVMGKPCIIFEHPKSLIKQNNSLKCIKVFSFDELKKRIEKLYFEKSYYLNYIEKSKSVIIESFEKNKTLDELMKIFEINR